MNRNEMVFVPFLLRGANMAEWVNLCPTEQIKEGESKSFEVKGKTIGVFHANGQFHAIDDFCPHMGAPLTSGHVEDGIVTCPWHAWRFRLEDGAWADNPRIKIGCHKLQIADGQLQVEV